MVKVIAGIDIGQGAIDISIAEMKKVKRVENNKSGMKKLLSIISEYGVEKVVLEATGGYERLVVNTLNHHEVAVSIVNPSWIRNFAKSQGQISKDDNLDAKLIRRYGEIMDPEDSIIDQNNYLLQQLHSRREQLVAFRKSERQRLKHPALPSLLQDNISENISHLTNQITIIEEEMQKLISEDSSLNDKQQRMITVPGIGTATACSLLANLPELGNISAAKLASLAGLAPHSHQSGKLELSKRIKGGRPNVRRSLYMAALSAKRSNPHLKNFADKLKLKGKAPKQIIIAVARKLLILLNSIVKNNSSFSLYHLDS